MELNFLMRVLKMCKTFFLFCIAVKVLPAYFSGNDKPLHRHATAPKLTLPHKGGGVAGRMDELGV